MGRLKVWGLFVAAAALMVPVNLLQSAGLPVQQRAAGAFTDYLDDTTGTATRIFPGNALGMNILQRTPGGLGRDLVAQLTPIANFDTRATDNEISLPTGDIIINDPYVRFSPTSYTTSYRFHIPREALPEHMQHLANIPAVASARPLERLIGLLSPALAAQTGDGLSGIVSQTFMPDTGLNGGGNLNTGGANPQQFSADPFGEQLRRFARDSIARSAVRDANVEELERRLIGQTISTGQCTDPEIQAARDFVQRARDLANDEMRFGRLTAAQQAASGQASELAARRAAIDTELRTGRAPVSSTRLSGSSGAAGAAAAARSSAGTARNVAGAGSRALSGVSTAFKLAEIEADSERWKKRLRELRECAEKPTNPAARRAQQEDPRYREATLDQITAAEYEEAIVTNTRRAALGLNSTAGALFRVLGSLATGVVEEVDDALMKQVQEEKMKRLETCITPCELKRTIQVEFNWSLPESASGCADRTCEDWTRTTSVVGRATLTLLPDAKGYEGTGQATYRYQFNSTRRWPGPGCTSSSSAETTSGQVGLDVKAYFSVANDRTGGVKTGRRDRSVFELVATPGQVAGTATSTECGDSKTERRTSEGPGLDCHIYDVDLKTGGTFSAFKDRDITSGMCTAVLTPR